MHVYRNVPDGEKYWAVPDTRAEAIEDAKYYMLMNSPITAIKIAVALCASADKTGDDAYDETLERSYETFYQKPKNRTE